MSKEILVPDIGADAVEVTEILVAVGDRVDQEQALINVEGDKASMEIPAPQAGIIEEIKISVGEQVQTGSLIMTFKAESNASIASGQEATPQQVQESSQSMQDVCVPDIGGDAVEVTEISVVVGDQVEKEQPLMTVEGDKASMEIPAPFAGTVKEIKVAVGAKVSTGSMIMIFETGARAQTMTPLTKAPEEPKSITEQSPSSATSSPAPVVNDDQFIENVAYAHASPLVRRLAREFGINLANIKATGRKGRIVKEDIQNYVKDLVHRSQAGAASFGSVMQVLDWPKVNFSKFGEIESVALSRIQKISGPNLHRNWVKIPHVTQFDEADITEMESFRKRENQSIEKRKGGFKVTPLAFILKACAKALEDYPKFCASLSDDGQSLIMKKYVHIGVAVDTPHGLVVPVLRDVNKKGIYALSKELGDVSQKARDGKLTSSDMQGGCFTISSLGGIGGTSFTPIVNAPEVAILGVSRAEMKQKWNGKDFQARLMLPLALSYDHRVIDGADGARFISTLSDYLSDLKRLAL